MSPRRYEMAFMFHRRLTIPLWAIAFFTVALTAPPTATLFMMPPTTVFAIVALGIAAIVVVMPGALPWLRTSRALVRVLPCGHRDGASAAIGGGVRTLDEPNRSTADDALDLAWTMTEGGS
jgi:hypothetical protein